MSEEPTKDLNDYIDDHLEQFKQSLFELLRIPSVSSQPEKYSQAMTAASQWLVERLSSMGMNVELLETGGNPVVFAELKSPQPNAPTVLIYGHYDVQPPEPLDQWSIDNPFEPVEKDDFVYARGASDDKGQLLTHVFALQAWLETVGSVPVNVKVLFEGDEECSNGCLDEYIHKNASKLACDCVVISDSQMFAPGRPAIAYGLRGILYAEVTYTGPKRDLHSGTYGGSITNPAVALAKTLARIHDERNKISIPGFYDDVKPISTEDQQQMANLGIDDHAFLESVGVEDSVGENGYTLLERRWMRPCFDICGLESGYTGAGAKTVLPSTATAKISFRIVPNQDPDKILDATEQFFIDNCPPGITCTFKRHSAAAAVEVDRHSPFMLAAVNTLESIFGQSVLFIRDGASIPVVLAFTEALKSVVLLLGWGQNSDNIHSPNERFNLKDFHRGIKASALLLKQIATINPQNRD